MLCGLLASCSYHYDQGQELEAQGRWEEAAIEYRIAYVDDPEDVEIREALERANLKVADDNFRRYQHYLQEHKFAKAYQRLEPSPSASRTLRCGSVSTPHSKALSEAIGIAP